MNNPRTLATVLEYDGPKIRTVEVVTPQSIVADSLNTWDGTPQDAHAFILESYIPQEWE